MYARSEVVTYEIKELKFKVKTLLEDYSTLEKRLKKLEEGK